ncbi:hypothetical protein ACQP2X_44210 [Actinoplanes sp. CA-131856]
MTDTQVGQLGKKDVLIELDDRRRVSLGRIGHKEHTRYLVHEAVDGTLTFHPVAVVRISEIENSEIRAQIEKARANRSERDDGVLLDDI